MYRIIGADQKEYGPISADQIRQWINQSRINQQTQIKPDGATDWQPLGSLPEFADDFAAPRPDPTPQRPAAYAGVAPKTSGMAITAFVLALVGLLCLITTIPAVILGIIALVQIGKSQGRLKGKGFAIASICISGVLILILPAMLLPALSKAKVRAQSITCVNFARSVNMGVISYASANNQLPPKATWCDAVQSNIGGPQFFKCPAAPNSRCGFAYNSNLDGKKLSEVDPQTVTIFESDAGWNGSGGADSAVSSPRHGKDGIVVGFADGSVQRIQPSQLSTLRWNP